MSNARIRGTSLAVTSMYDGKDTADKEDTAPERNRKFNLLQDHEVHSRIGSLFA